MVFCGKCGKKNPDDNLYCSQCGARLNTEEKPPTYEPQHIVGGPTGPIAADELVPSELKRDPNNPNGYVVVPVDKERAMSYRIPIIVMGFVMCAIVLALVFVMEIPYDIYGVNTGLKITTENFTLWELLNGGYNSTLSLCIVAIIILALLSIYNYCFSELALVVFMVVVLSSTMMLQDVQMGYVQVKMLMDVDNYLVTFSAIVLLSYAVSIIPLYLYQQFSKLYPLKGALYRMNKLWKP